MKTAQIVLSLVAALTITSTAQGQGLDVPQEKPPEPHGSLNAPNPAVPKVQGRGWLGVGLGVEMFKGRECVRVESVFDGSPAASSGIQKGDLILKYQGTEMGTIQQLVTAVGETQPGSKVVFQLRRKEKVFDVPLLLGLRPDRLALLRSQTLHKPAPAMDVATLGSETRFTNANLRGKIVVLDFWATWCGPCRATIPELNRLHKKYADRGVVVLGITDEPADTVKAFQKKTPMAYPIGLDGEERAVNKAFFIQAYPTLMLMDQQGVIREVFIGASRGKIGALESTIETLLQP